MLSSSTRRNRSSRRRRSQPPRARMARPSKFACRHKAHAAGLTTARHVRSKVQGQLGYSFIAYFLVFSFPFSTRFAVASVVFACRCGQNSRSGAWHHQIRCCCGQRERSCSFALFLVRGKLMPTIYWSKQRSSRLIELSGVQTVFATMTRNFRPHLVSLLDCPPLQELFASGGEESAGRRCRGEPVKQTVYYRSNKEEDEERRRTEEQKKRRSTTIHEWKKQRCKKAEHMILIFIWIARCNFQICTSLLLGYALLLVRGKMTTITKPEPHLIELTRTRVQIVPAHQDEMESSTLSSKFTRLSTTRVICIGRIGECRQRKQRRTDETECLLPITTYRDI